MNGAMIGKLLEYQRSEITEHHIYRKIASSMKPGKNRETIERIARDEMRHYEIWRSYTGRDVRPDLLKLWFYYLISLVLGFTFAIKLMEQGEDDAQSEYRRIGTQVPEAGAILEDETSHEEALIRLLEEERIRYTGSMVLGLNDALVELTGALAGLTLALQDAHLIALTGSITGIAAAMSMAASEYLSTKAEETSKNPVRASVYTGIAYIVTVLVLITPYLILPNYYVSLGVTLILAVLIIAFFTYYLSVVKDVPFKSRFFEMAGLSLGIAFISFLVGFALRTVFGVEV
ncbi:MAG: VIT1/CCC1 transporter family protein [Desulfomonilia bacterium]|jgi:VIT1/CCC1 family predicted Fe2+/Mn2+ transporter|nr:VIT1/CCC1 transporter family protein [Pseudomonadota bacterium]HON39111.1 VIT1/CCC1 transporter family protein [Deltaproteobacteria bacterium]HPD21194.1 VIT1/CCC1 transporter family protein [Deltaproteobacteria bacterium]HRS56129.1 VIT1/CCC1 transporter family protein [Desulfomonilia bacterium]HRV35891.1 VIT1/CCC1 transporter family protein [Desulfomonilia bacterium]